MAVISVDLAYKSYADIGTVVLHREANRIGCSLLEIPLDDAPAPGRLARFLDAYCRSSRINILLLDGPQGWRADGSDPAACRRSERELNTPAKTGLPGSVKPSNYAPFVRFSIAVYDALGRLGWERLAAVSPVAQKQARIVVESFPTSAWKALKVPPLPAKAKATTEDLVAHVAALASSAGLRSRPASHSPREAVQP
jgi:hypothetical protein